MRRMLGTLSATVVFLALCGAARAEGDKDVNAVLDKAIKALGGEDKLRGVKAVQWSGKGKIFLGGNENDFTSTTTIQDLDHYRQEFEGDFGGNKITGATVVAGDKGWRKFADNTMEMDKDALANEKRAVYLNVAPVTVLPLKDKGFKVEAAGEEKVADKPAAVLKVTGPDGKDFKLYFDKESGLPVKMVAKVVGFMGEEYTQETTYGDYKEMGGIKKATKVNAKRDGEKFIDATLTEFRPLEKVDPKTFEEPK